jgi:PAS domain S-box-containing protein
MMEPDPPGHADHHRDQLAAIIDNTPNVAIQGYDTQARVTLWNNASAELYGFTMQQAMGKRLDELIWSAAEQEQFERMIAAILSSGRPAPMKEWSIRTRAGDDRHILSTLFPIRSSDGQTRVICMDVDITPRKRVEEALRASEEHSRDLARRLGELLRELDHRVKNTLASLHALVDMYARTAPSVAAFAEAMRGKLMAMRAAHELTTAERGRPVLMTDLLHSFIRQHEPPGRGGSSIRFDGPSLRIAPRQVAPLAMILQELFANASKHGAYRDPEGKVAITWTILESQATGSRARITWREMSTRRITAPRTRGVGLALIESFARFEMCGNATLQFLPTGLVCELNCQLDPDTP